MFTGIIEVVSKVQICEGGVLVLRRPRSFTDTRVGSSLCVSGVCLTVTAIGAPHPSTSSGQAPNPLPRGEGKKSTITFDVVPETLRCTTLGSLKIGSRVNLERAILATGRFEGHIVQGHVEAVGEILSLSKDGMLKLAYPRNLKGFIVEKGSIALDGVSLTVAKIRGNQVTIALIPHTLKHTTLGLLKKGDRVNIETDILGRYARRACSL